MGGVWDGGGAFYTKIHAFFAFWDAKTPSGTGAGLKNSKKAVFLVFSYRLTAKFVANLSVRGKKCFFPMGTSTFSGFRLNIGENPTSSLSLDYGVCTDSAKSLRISVHTPHGPKSGAMLRTVTERRLLGGGRSLAFCGFAKNHEIRVIEFFGRSGSARRKKDGDAERGRADFFFETASAFFRG
jgi:hypothetical protein